MPTFERLTRAALRALPAGSRIAEHGIYYEKLPNGDGRFGVQLRIDGEKVNRVIGKESEGVTRGEAEAFIDRLKTEAREGRLRLPKGRKLEMRFEEAANKYQERLNESDGKNLKRKKEQFKLHLVPFFGSKPITQISTFDVDRYKSIRKKEGASTGTINGELALLSHLYNMAKSWNWLGERPFEIKKLPNEAKREDYLTPEQCVQLLTAARIQDHELYLFILIGLATGMRSGEIMSVRLEHINLSQGRLFIPKAKAGARNQPISAELETHLKYYIDQYCVAEQVWLFPSKKSKTGHRVSVRKAFRNAVKSIGLDPDVFVRHTLRHTAVSLLVQAGVDIPTVMQISGHKTQEMVLRYSHRDGSHIRQAMNKLDSALKGNAIRLIKEA
jgi:integrase